MHSPTFRSGTGAENASMAEAWNPRIGDEKEETSRCRRSIAISCSSAREKWRVRRSRVGGARGLAPDDLVGSGA